MACGSNLMSDCLQQENSFLSTIPPCDIIMQLDNMLAGGMETVAIDLANSLQEHGYRIAILVLGNAGKDAEKAVALGLQVCVIPFEEDLLRQQLMEATPKVIFAHYSFQGTDLYAELNIPFIQVVHNVYAWLDENGRQNFTNSIPNTMLFIAVSPVVREYTVKELGVPDKKCITIANGIETRKFIPLEPQEKAEKRKELGFAPDEYLFISVASVNPIKRLFALVKSFHLASLAGVNATLVLIGYSYDAAYLQDILDYIERYNLKDTIRYLGHTHSPEMYYSIADAQLHGSTIEGGQLTFLEALTANLSIVTTDVGFAPLFKGHKGLRIVERNFPYEPKSFVDSRLLAGGGKLIADLASEIRHTYAERVKPDLSQQITKLFDCQNTYLAYAKIVKEIMAGNTSISTPVGWCDLIEKTHMESDSELPPLKDSEGYYTLFHMVAERDTQLAELDAKVAQLTVTLNEVYPSKSWRITAPLRKVLSLLKKHTS